MQVADAGSLGWMQPASIAQTTIYINNEDYEADAYLLLDQDPGMIGLAEAGRLQVPLQGFEVNFGSSGAISGQFDGTLCTTPGSSSPPAGQDSRKGSSAAPNKCSKGGRKCTTVAQREAHKRYREKKKQNIAAMESEVQAKQQELIQLQAENEKLKSRARVLETAERCSSEIHELMQLLDGLQSLEDAGITPENRAGSSCNSLARSYSSRAPAAGASRASMAASTAELSTAAAAAGTAAGSAGALGASSDSFLQTLMLSSCEGQQPAAAAVKQEPAAAAVQTQMPQPQRPALLSLQDETHWLQMAQRYVDAPQLVCPSMQQVQHQHEQLLQQSLVPGHGNTARTWLKPAMAAALSTAAVTECALAQESPSLSSVCPSSTAESGSSVLLELGSVDTPEQGLMVYKAFLQRASEMLAMAQQQQMQEDLGGAAATEEQLGELTRTTISRLQPFLVARGQGVVYDWNARNLDTQRPEEPPANLWPAVLDALQLTDDTRRDAVQCFELFGTPLTRLLEERTQLAERYRDLQTTQCSSARSSCDSEASVVTVAHARTFEAVAEPLISSMAILKALAANLERYQSLDGVFAHSLTNLLTGAQIAAACVASYPYLPRWHAMMSALKMQEQQQQLRQQQQRSGPVGARAASQRRSSRVRSATHYD